MTRLKRQHRINEQIRAKEVRIVGDEVEPKVIQSAQAIQMASRNERRFRGNFT